MPQVVVSVLCALAVAAAGLFVSSWIANLVDRSTARIQMDPIVRRLLVMGVRPLVWCIAIIMALPFIGIGPESILTVLAGASLSVGLALRDHLSNVASGAILLTLRPYGIGDLVTVGTSEGRVEGIGLFETVLRRLDGAEVTLRNDLVLLAPIVNHTRTGKRRFEIDVHIGWASELDAATLRAREAVAAVAEVLKEPAPTVLLEALPNTGPVLRVRAWCPPESYVATRGAAALAAARAVQTLPPPTA